jgi:hypothetical protein
MTDYYFLLSGNITISNTQTIEGVFDKIYKQDEIQGILISSISIPNNSRVVYSSCTTTNPQCPLDIKNKYATYDELLQIASLISKGFVKDITTSSASYNNLLQNIGSITGYYAYNTPTENNLHIPTSLSYTLAEHDNKHSEVQNKIIELKRTDNSVYQEKQRELDMAIYANLMWTVLATSMIYYIFIEL